MRALRVGGAYWGVQPSVPGDPYCLARTSNRAALSALIIEAEGPVVCWLDSPSTLADVDNSNVTIVSGECDPWHLLGGAASVVTDEGDELCALAAAADLPVTVADQQGFRQLAFSAANELLAERLLSFDYFDPFTGASIDAGKAIELCGFWRRLIDGNRTITAAAGFALWKRPTVEPLLWPGPSGVRFIANAGSVSPGDGVAIWRARASSRLLRELERRKASLVEVEDGFIRSAGLGADCVPPLSIVVDRLGAHFDPTQPSELEELLQQGEIPAPLLDRARRLRHAIVASGLSKYAAGGKPLRRRHPSRTHVLVPGQVEDDRAVVSGGAGLSSNLELLRRVRASCPDGYIIYKPHPDVEAGHRSGAVADERCLEFADEIVRSEPISTLLDLADEVHVNTSLAGFEALLRRTKVTTHGVPFYAGWGLTHDLGPVPARRTAKRTLDELVAATLLVYPRYVDPLTFLPCPAEVVVDRLADGRTEGMGGLVVRLRRMQGRVRRSLAAVRSLVAA
jgi:capsular polysaccharide export protein